MKTIRFACLFSLLTSSGAFAVDTFVDAGVIHGYSFEKSTWNLGVVGGVGATVPVWTDAASGDTVPVTARVSLESHKGAGLSLLSGYSTELFAVEAGFGVKRYSFWPKTIPFIEAGVSMPVLKSVSLFHDPENSLNCANLKFRLLYMPDFKVLQTGVFFTVPIVFNE